MIQTEPNIDPISATVALVAVVFAPEVAHVVGPYLVIMFASTIGASFALGARDKSSRLGALWFFLRINGLALLMTYAIAAGVNSVYPMEDQRAWFAPVAFIIGFIGDRWPRLLMWAAGKISRSDDLEKKLGGGKNSGGERHD